tara:strand:- start:1610 stop:2590 length:981 start_codon:yes stop_codon:yes gene_type:complete
MKIAVVGTGSAGRHHLEALRQLDDVEPIAVPIRHTRMAELEAEGYRTAPSIQMASSLGAEAAIIATDTGRHFQDAITALEEGMDILVEKPMSVDSMEAHRLCQRASNLHRETYIGYVLRFSDSLNTFRRLLNELGQIHFVRLECQSYLPDWRPNRPYEDTYSARAHEGGVLRDLVHEIDYAGWLFGWPLNVQARLENTGRLGIDAEELAALIWDSPAGCLVSVSLDYLSTPPRRLMTAFGEGGSMSWDGIAGTVSLARVGAPVEELKHHQSADQLFCSQAYAFTNAMLGVRDPHLASGSDGVKAMAVCDAARQASEKRIEQTVVYP